MMRFVPGCVRRLTVGSTRCWLRSIHRRTRPVKRRDSAGFSPNWRASEEQGMVMIESRQRKLEGRVALVTGGGSGIGRAISVLFAQEGAQVATASRTRTSIDETARLAGGETLALEADVSDEQSVRRMVDQTLERFGRIDILVNNAGVGTTKSILEVEPEEWDRVFAVNVRGVYLSTRSVLPGMLAQGEGVIINIASALGMVG